MAPFTCQGYETYLELKQDNASTWLAIRQAYQMRLEGDLTASFIRALQEVEVDYQAHEKMSEVYHFIELTWETVRQQVISGEFEYVDEERSYRYVRGVGLNHIRRWKRAIYKKRKNEVALDKDETLLSRATLASTPAVEDQVLDQITCELILDVLDADVTQIQKEIFLRRVLEGVSSEILGRDYGYTPGYIDQIVHRVKVQVRRRLDSD